MSAQRSDLRARVLVALPAIAVALFLVIEGGTVFTLGLFVLGCVCMHEPSSVSPAPNCDGPPLGLSNASGAMTWNCPLGTRP